MKEFFRPLSFFFCVGESIERSVTQKSASNPKYVDNKDGFRSFAHRELQQFSKNSFYKEAKKMIPKLKLTDLVKSKKVGIRAQLYNKDKHEFEMDFIVEKKDNTIHVLNAVSPAFTSAFSFAKYILRSQ